MTQPLTASDRGLTPHWKVRVVLPGAILHVASWTEPRLDAPRTAPAAEWIDDPAYGDTIGYIDWTTVVAITWRHAA